jgi:FkbM family methyltransferase
MASPSLLPSWISGRWRHFQGRPRQGIEIAVESIFLGTEYGGYAVIPSLLPERPLAYSVGLGEDISFDLALIDGHRARVHGFDPTPRSLAWLEQQDLPDAFTVHPYGVADFDGTARFTPPENPAWVSHSIRPGDAPGAIEMPVKRLTTILSELGHERVDLLKMDIEGAEYAVIEDLLKHVPLPKQLLLEYHHGMGDTPLVATEQSLDRLRAAGYRVFDARESGREFSLVLK